MVCNRLMLRLASMFPHPLLAPLRKARRSISYMCVCKDGRVGGSKGKRGGMVEGGKNVVATRCAHSSPKVLSPVFYPVELFPHGCISILCTSYLVLVYEVITRITSYCVQYPL